MECVLCDSLNEKYRIIKETEYSFAVICKWPLKLGHVIVLPKKHVTQTQMNNLTNKELKDYISLIQEIEDKLNSKFEEPTITFKNSKKHSTQEHLHYHLLPSKGALRDLFSNYENIPKRKEISKEKYIEMKEYLK
jgi:diadenosine tetraphosphate (Ap4A) HIT family hydrolase